MSRTMKRKHKKMASKTMTEKKHRITANGIEAAVPTHRLSGRAAEELDRLVEEAMKDYREGKARDISVLFKKFKRREK